MSGLKALGFSGTLSTMEAINQELARKRKELDEEIQRFTEEKNAEYEAFEKEIQSHHGKSSARTIQAPSNDWASIVERGFSVSKPYEASLQSLVVDNESYEPDMHPSPATLPTTVWSAEDFVKQPIEPLSPIGRASDQEDRQFELGALFTPGYLPLLDSTFSQQDYRKALSSTDDRISSSLDVDDQAPIMARPPLSDRRLSSSPVNSGRGHKKSSLRRSAGSDSIRERKHVLFSIDNQVISPNASPENLRTLSSTAPASTFPNLQDLHLNHSANSSIEATTYLPSMSPWVPLKSPISPTRTYRDLVEPTVVTPPEELDKEDLHLSTKDPLFDSDDPALALEEEEEWQHSPPESKSSDEEEILATSPHVSSIPIQIRQKRGR